jgi:hypothetical protein
VDTNNEHEVACDVERQLLELLVSSPSLSGLPIARLRGLSDLVRLELALRRFAEIHRSGQSRALIRRVKGILSAARRRLLGAAINSPGLHAHETALLETQPAVLNQP